jgi:protein ImuB
MMSQSMQPLLTKTAAVAAVQPCLRPVALPELPPPDVTQLRSRQKPIWLALHFSAWPMAAMLSGMAGQHSLRLREQPFAVIDTDRKRRVLVCNERARMRGLRPGHSLNAAIALCSELQVAVRDLDREATLLEATARNCQRYTSTVSIEPPNELLLEVRGSLRLFGGVAALVKTVLDDFAVREIAVSAAVASTARGALWLSRTTRAPQIIRPRDLQAALACLPISVLQWSPDITLRLSRCGARTIGDLRRLPRGALSRRIGAGHVRELDAALGRQPDLRRTVLELPEYRDRVVLDAEIETTGLLQPLLEARLVALERFLTARTLALTGLVIELVHRQPPVTTVQMGLAMPTADMRHLQVLIRERLSTLQIPSPILELRMQVSNLVPAECRSQQLFHAGQRQGEGLEQRLTRLLETLESRLGRQAVSALQIVADHRPERAQSQTQITQAQITLTVSPDIPEWLPQRPLWLLRGPTTLGSTLPAELTVLSGPEAIEAGWWDAGSCRREYFIARDRQGALCWIFRDLAEPGGWYLHGWFG